MPPQGNPSACVPTRQEHPSDMQNCPSCQMLMEDHDDLCTVCAGERATPPPFQGAAGSPSTEAFVGGPQGPATALLERPPTAVPMPETVRYRTRKQRRMSPGVVVIGVLLLGALVVLVAMGVRGDGPLAEQVVDMGLVAAPAVSVPDAWGNRSSDGGGFSVDLPAGATVLDEPVNLSDPAAGTVRGFEVELGVGGEASVAAVEQPGAAELVGAADDGAFAMLVQRFVTNADLGEVGATREVAVGNGRAMDVVLIDDADARTTRARFHEAGGRLYLLVTSGLDEFGNDLDRVHARLTDSFEPDPA